MEIFTKINWVDILAVIILLRISYVAFTEGLSHEIFPLIGAIFTISFALHYYNNIALYITQNITWISMQLSAFLAFAVSVIAIGFLFKLAKIILDKIIKVTWHPLIEKFGGLIAGALRALLVVCIILNFIALIPLSYLQWSVKDRSLTGKYFLLMGKVVHDRTRVFLPALRGPAQMQTSISNMKNAK